MTVFFSPRHEWISARKNVGELIYPNICGYAHTCWMHWMRLWNEWTQNNLEFSAVREQCDISSILAVQLHLDCSRWNSSFFFLVQWNTKNHFTELVPHHFTHLLDIIDAQKHNYWRMIYNGCCDRLMLLVAYGPLDLLEVHVTLW